MELAKLKSILLSGAIKSLFVRVVGVLLSFFLNVLLARSLDQSSYGEYIFLINNLLILVVFLKLGLPSATVRFVSEYTSQSKWAELLGYKRHAMKVLLISSSIGYVLVLLFLLFGPLNEYPSLSWLVLFLIPAYVFLHYFQELCRGMQKIVSAQIVERVVVPFCLLTFVWICIQYKELKVSEVLLFQLTTVLCGLLYLYFAQRDKGCIRNFQRECKDEVLWKSVSFSLFQVAVFNILISRIDVTVIGVMGGTQEVAGYAIAAKVSELLRFFQGAISVALAPLIAEKFHSGNKADLQHIVSLSVKWSFACSLPFIVIVVCFPAPILSLFGEGYTSYDRILQILVLGQIVNILSGAVGPLLAMTGEQRVYARVIMALCVLNLCLLPFVYQVFAIEGMAVSKSLLEVATNLALVFLVSKKLGVNSFFLVSKTKGDG